MESIENLTKWRKELNISQKTIGKIIGGISLYVVWLYEHKKYKIPPERLKMYEDFICKCRENKEFCAQYKIRKCNNWHPHENFCTARSVKVTRNKRLRLGITLKEASEILGITPAALCFKELGINKMFVSDYKKLMAFYKQEEEFLASIPERR